MDLTLEDDQSDELGEVIRTIEENVPEELDAVFREASDCSVSIRDAWENNKKIIKQTEISYAIVSFYNRCDAFCISYIF